MLKSKKVFVGAGVLQTTLIIANTLKLKKYNLTKEKNYYLDAYLFISLIISSVLHESYTNNQSVTFGLIPIYSILIFLFWNS